MVAFRLAKAGYCGGNPLEIMKLPADTVLSLLQYENFTVDMENAYYQMNKDENGR